MPQPTVLIVYSRPADIVSIVWQVGSAGNETEDNAQSSAMQEASFRLHQGHRRGVVSLKQPTVYLPLYRGGLYSPSHNFLYLFTLIHGYSKFENRGRTALLLAALLPLLLALPLLLTLAKFVVLLVEASRNQ